MTDTDYYHRTAQSEDDGNVWPWGDDDCLVGIGEIGSAVAYSGANADEGLAIVRDNFTGKACRSKRGALFIGELDDGRPWQANFILPADAETFHAALISAGAEVKRLGA